MLVRVRVRAVLFPGKRQARVGRTLAGKLFAKESLELPNPTSRPAGFGVRAACSRDDAGNGRPSVIVVVGRFVRVGACRGRVAGSNIQRPKSRRRLGSQGEVVARVIVEAGRDVPGNGGNGAGAVACGPGRDLADGARGWVVVTAALPVTASRGFEDGQIAAVVCKVAHSVFANGRIGGVGGRRRQSQARRGR